MLQQNLVHAYMHSCPYECLKEGLLERSRVIELVQCRIVDVETRVQGGPGMEVIT
jgi:hypothetical protein